MKHIIFALALTTLFTTNIYAQDKESKVEDVKLITSSCTITKPIKYLTSPELGIDFDILKDGVSIIIKWNPINDGGSCYVSIKFGDKEFPINNWSDYNDLTLIRVKMTNGYYNYTLRNSMFCFFNLVYDDNEAYGFSSELKEID